MYICLCFAISEKKVRKMISEGAKSVKDIQQETKAGNSCGSCLCKLQEMVSLETEKTTTLPDPLQDEESRY